MLIGFGIVLFELNEGTGTFPDFGFPEPVFIMCRSAHVTWLMNQKNQNTASMSRKNVENRKVSGRVSHRRRKLASFPALTVRQH